MNAGTKGPGARRRFPAGIPLGVAAAALLASCSPAVVLAPEAADLKGAVEAAVPKGTRVLLEGQPGAAKAFPRDVVRISSTPGWNLPAGIGPAAALPAGWAKSARYEMPPSLAALGRRADGSWSAVPLLYDLLGKTAFAADASSPPPSGEWGATFAKAEPRSIAVAGSRPSFRQAAYFLELGGAFAGPGEAANWFSQPASGRPDPSATLSPIASSAALLPDAWRYSRADLMNLYKVGSKLAFLETFRDFELANPPGFRRFAPLASARDGSPAVAGIILFAEFRGDLLAAGGAARIVSSLASPAFQKAAGVSGKWLAANRQAPEIDTEGALARSAAEKAARFYPLADRLPEPPVEGCLLETVQFAPRGASGK